jgi:glycosyltransferase involved in cell wall biosynthesis
MIVKNEEAVLARCLDSVKKAVDEIIIVDTGSTDKTKSIAHIFTDNAYSFAWIDDFSAARNEAFSKATKDYQMWLDADDVISEEEIWKLLALKETLDDTTDIVTMKYITHADSQGNPINISTRGRLFKREKGYKWEDPIHEYITLSGVIVYSDIVIHHKRNPKEGQHDRNINIYTIPYISTLLGVP